MESWHVGQAGLASCPGDVPPPKRGSVTQRPWFRGYKLPIAACAAQRNRQGGGFLCTLPPYLLSSYVSGRRTFTCTTTCPAVLRSPGLDFAALRLLRARRKLPASPCLFWEQPGNFRKYLINLRRLISPDAVHWLHTLFRSALTMDPSTTGCREEPGP